MCADHNAVKLEIGNKESSTYLKLWNIYLSHSKFPKQKKWPWKLENALKWMIMKILETDTHDIHIQLSVRLRASSPLNIYITKKEKLNVNVNKHQINKILISYDTRKNLTGDLWKHWDTNSTSWKMVKRKVGDNQIRITSFLCKMYLVLTRSQGPGCWRLSRGQTVHEFACLTEQNRRWGRPGHGPPSPWNRKLAHQHWIQMSASQCLQPAV